MKSNLSTSNQKTTPHNSENNNPTEKREEEQTHSNLFLQHPPARQQTLDGGLGQDNESTYFQKPQGKEKKNIIEGSSEDNSRNIIENGAADRDDYHTPSPKKLNSNKSRERYQAKTQSLETIRNNGIAGNLYLNSCGAISIFDALKQLPQIDANVDNVDNVDRLEFARNAKDQCALLVPKIEELVKLENDALTMRKATERHKLPEAFYPSNLSDDEITSYVAGRMLIEDTDEKSYKELLTKNKYLTKYKEAIQSIYQEFSLDYIKHIYSIDLYDNINSIKESLNELKLTHNPTNKEMFLIIEKQVTLNSLEQKQKSIKLLKNFNDISDDDIYNVYKIGRLFSIHDIFDVNPNSREANVELEKARDNYKNNYSNLELSNAQIGMIVGKYGFYHEYKNDIPMDGGEKVIVTYKHLMNPNLEFKLVNYGYSNKNGHWEAVCAKLNKSQKTVKFDSDSNCKEHSQISRNDLSSGFTLSQIHSSYNNLSHRKIIDPNNIAFIKNTENISSFNLSSKENFDSQPPSWTSTNNNLESPDGPKTMLSTSILGQKLRLRSQQEIISSNKFLDINIDKISSYVDSYNSLELSQNILSLKNIDADVDDLNAGFISQNIEEQYVDLINTPAFASIIFDKNLITTALDKFMKLFPETGLKVIHGLIQYRYDIQISELKNDAAKKKLQQILIEIFNPLIDDAAESAKHIFTNFTTNLILLVENRFLGSSIPNNFKKLLQGNNLYINYAIATQLPNYLKIFISNEVKIAAPETLVFHFIEDYCTNGIDLQMFQLICKNKVFYDKFCNICKYPHLSLGNEDKAVKLFKLYSAAILYRESANYNYISEIFNNSTILDLNIQMITDEKDYHNNPKEFLNKNKRIFKQITNADQLINNGTNISVKTQDGVIKTDLSGRHSSVGEVRGQVLIDNFRAWLKGHPGENLVDYFKQSIVIQTKDDLINSIEFKYLEPIVMFSADKFTTLENILSQDLANRQLFIEKVLQTVAGLLYDIVKYEKRMGVFSIESEKYQIESWSEDPNYLIKELELDQNRSKLFTQDIIMDQLNSLMGVDDFNNKFASIKNIVLASYDDSEFKKLVNGSTDIKHLSNILYQHIVTTNCLLDHEIALSALAKQYGKSILLYKKISGVYSLIKIGNPDDASKIFIQKDNLFNKVFAKYNFFSNSHRC